MTTILNLIYMSKSYRLVILLVCLSVSVFGTWQIVKTQTMRTQDREHIVKIFNEIIERSEFNINGARVVVRWSNKSG